jgi:hypothetical protein
MVNAVFGDSAAPDIDSAIHQMQLWNERKRKMFRPDHMGIAWNRVKEEGWLTD